jgi:hypothetical protein
MIKDLIKILNKLILVLSKIKIIKELFMMDLHMLYHKYHLLINKIIPNLLILLLGVKVKKIIISTNFYEDVRIAPSCVYIILSLFPHYYR